MIRHSRGFSLVELMIVVAIIGIIAGVAYPSYQNYLDDTYKAQAVTDLMSCSLALDRYYSNNNFSYLNADTNNVCVLNSPQEGTTRFNITYVTLTATDFLLQATPVGGAPCGGDCVRLAADGTRSEL